MNRGIDIRSKGIFCDRDQIGCDGAVAEAIRSKQLK